MGYILITMEDGSRALEHRLVYEHAHRIKLLSHQIVHHINGNPIDNRIENLMIFESAGAHRIYHMTVGLRET